MSTPPSPMTEPLPLDPDTARTPVVGHLEQWDAGEWPAHQHKRHQLMAVSSGVMHVTTSVGTWMLPSTRAIWISAGTKHHTLVRRPTHLRVLYIDPNAYDLPRDAYCWVIDITPLMQELISTCVALPWDYPDKGPEDRLARVLIDQVMARDYAPVDLPMPVDSRALKVAHMLQSDPANREPLTVLAERAGASARTIEWLFVKFR